MDEAVDFGPLDGVARRVVAAVPGVANAVAGFVRQADRHALRAEFVVAGGSQVVGHARVALGIRGEEGVLPHERLHVGQRMADRDHEPGIGKEGGQVLDADDVVVALGQIAAAAAEQQNLADVVSEESVELGRTAARPSVDARTRPHAVGERRIARGALRRLRDFRP